MDAKNNFLAGVSTLKHWDAYSLEDSDGSRRYDFNAIVSNYALATSYFPAFAKSVQEGGALGVMCALLACPHAPPIPGHLCAAALIAPAPFPPPCPRLLKVPTMP